MTGDPRRPKGDIRQAFLAPVTPIRNGPTPRTPPSVQRGADRRNGLPEVKRYVWHRGDVKREAEIAAYQAEVTRLRDELLAEREAEILAELDAIRALRNQGETT